MNDAALDETLAKLEQCGLLLSVWRDVVLRVARENPQVTLIRRLADVEYVPQDAWDLIPEHCEYRFIKGDFATMHNGLLLYFQLWEDYARLGAVRSHWPLVSPNLCDFEIAAATDPQKQILWRGHKQTVFASLQAPVFPKGKLPLSQLVTGEVLIHHKYGECIVRHIDLEKSQLTLEHASGTGNFDASLAKLMTGEGLLLAP